jgi:ribosomal protein S18 acetylase RimI-like enzyme
VTALELRAPTESDAAAIAALLNAISAAHYGESEVDADEIRSWFHEPDIQFVLAERGGNLVGYGDIGWDKRRPHTYWLDLRALPGSGTAGPLLEELERRAVPRDEPPVLLRSYADAGEPEVASALTGRGYRVVRHAFRMRRELDRPVEDAALPPGLELRPYRIEDEARVHEANMDSFADHWDFAPSALEDWRRRQVERPGADTTLWQLAYDGDELAGICLCRRYSTEEPKFGWVDVLGVRPTWRRRGLGRALLLLAFREFERRGYDAVGLGVDGENTTGAVRLYERAGMEVRRRHDLYERTLA